MKTTLSVNQKNMIARFIPRYERMVLAVLDGMIERYERDPEYHFIDTKINIISGQDYDSSAPEDFFKSKEVIYSWIQGRALESLAGHAIWMENYFKPVSGEMRCRIRKIRQIMQEVMESMERIRYQNRGRMFFSFSREGKPLESNHGELRELNHIPDGSNFSDLFYSKGLFSAASYLKMSDKAEESQKYFLQVINDISNHKFITDQQSFDPKNQVVAVHGKYLQGPFMIALSGIAEFAAVTGDSEWLKTGCEFMAHIFKHYINFGSGNEFLLYDFWEAIDAKGKPWKENGAILSDPGHALEFVGLSLKLLLQMEKKTEYATFVEECRDFYPKMMRHYWQQGFNQKSGGICKAYDLCGRCPLNTDMPWWSLPETVRAAAEMIKFAPDSSAVMMEVIEQCSTAFLGKFVNPAVYSMAYQTRSSNGAPTAVIPAVPDADPGYHSGLSIITFLNIFAEIDGD